MEQLAVAIALREAHYAEAHPPLRKLQGIVLSKLTRDAELGEIGLRVQILQTRMWKWVPSLRSPEDEFPLMEKHSEL